MTDSPATDGSDAPATDDESSAVRRRWLIRLLVGLGIGIPVVIEARTFLGLFWSYLAGSGEDDGTGEGTTTPTTTAPSGVGVGDELLAATPQTETVRASYIQVEGSDRRFELSVEVDNTGETPYELRFGAVRTAGGESVDGGASTGRIPPGETATVTGTWELPSGDRPESVTVTALTYAGDGVELTERQVRLERVSFRG
jgi:hypothetical protein